jgi:hypothetical protein
MARLDDRQVQDWVLPFKSSGPMTTVVDNGH